MEGMENGKREGREKTARREGRLNSVEGKHGKQKERKEEGRKKKQDRIEEGKGET